MDRKKISDSGFTGVELLVALAFVGALGGVAYSVLDRNHSIEREHQSIETIRALQEQLVRYYDIHGGYPSSLGVLDDRFRYEESYLYAALDKGCTSYHLGVRFQDVNKSVLATDVDAHIGTLGEDCPDGENSGPDFSGEDPVYDVKP